MTTSSHTTHCMDRTPNETKMCGTIVVEGKLYYICCAFAGSIPPVLEKLATLETFYFGITSKAVRR